MVCWLQRQQQGAKEEMSMSSFAERQAALIAQVLGGFAPGPEGCLHVDQRFSPCDFPLIQQEQIFDMKCCGQVSNSVPIDAWDVADRWEESGLISETSGFEPLPYQVHDVPEHMLFHAVDEDKDRVPLGLLAWQTQPDLSELCCREPPAKRVRNCSFYTLDDVLKKLPRGVPEPDLCTDARPSLDTINIPLSPITILPSPQFSSDLSLSSPPPFSVGVSCSPTSSFKEHSEVNKQHLLPLLQNYCKPPYASVEPQSIAARHRRNKIREKIGSLEKLIPLGSKLDTARMLEESIKYVKFLQAQVQVLECMPLGDSKPDLKSNPNLNSNPNGAMNNANLCLRSSSNASSGSGWGVSLTNALTLQRSASASLMKKLSAQQMLHALLTSSTIQRKLFSTGKVIGTVQQKETFAAAPHTLSSGAFSNFKF